MRAAPSLALEKELLNRRARVHVQRANSNIGMHQQHYGQAGAWAASSNQGTNKGSVLQASCVPQNDTGGDGMLSHLYYNQADAKSNSDRSRNAAECPGINSFPAKASQTQSLAQSLAEMRPAEAIPVYVMLPLDTVNADGVFRYAYIPWFAQALQVLALSGVHGVAVDVWWCAVERAPRQYSWTGYRQLFEMVRGAGLKLQVVLSFHACGGNVGDLAQVPLPSWVLEAGQQDPDIFFTDRPRECGLGRRNKEYLSIWADDAPVLPAGPGAGSRSPLQAYGEFMAAFRDAFAGQLGSLVEEVVVGAGPCGELRYPSYVEANGWRFPGVGEFQCYDRRALASLAAAAAAAGRPEWGYAGPHDSGGYNSSPGDTGFFAPGGSWDTEYGSFFLNWYSSCLLQHGERLLQLANHVFGPHKAPKQQLHTLSDLGLGMDGSSRQQQQQQQQPRRRQQQQRLVLTLKIAGVHWWYNSTSHASELTAGYYNTDSRDGYSPILQLCEKHAVNLTLTCVEMCDAQHPSYALCGPEGLLRQIRAMAAKQQVTLSGENALPIFTPGAGAASSSRGSPSPGGGSSSSSAAPGEVQLLPAMRAFTFLRLGPEILQPDCHANWMRFMHRMLNERA
ncbi:hypothetical protein OEZ86_002301 [Tetradesmus obliquus]|nr:hypothetical protein OEZ86_002301 [Tetradesmus obliquus]